MARMNFNVYIPGSRPTSTAEHPQGIGQRDKPTLTSLGIDVDRLITEHKQEITAARNGSKCLKKQGQRQRKSSASTGRKSTNSAESTRQSRHHGRKSGTGSAAS